MTQEQLLKSLDSAISRYNRLAESKPKYRIPTISYRKTNNSIELIGSYSEAYKKNVGFLEKFTIGGFDQELRSAWSSIEDYYKYISKKNKEGNTEKKNAAQKTPSKDSWIIETKKGTKYVSMGAFMGSYTTSIIKVTIPSDLKEIPGDDHTHYYPNMTDAFFPEGLEKIGKRIFGRSEKMECMKFPLSVKFVGEGNIPNSLKTLIVPSSIFIKLEPKYNFSDQPSLEKLVVIINNNNNGKVLLSHLSSIINKRTKIMFCWNGYVWNANKDILDILQKRDIELENLSRQIEYGNAMDAYPISTDSLLGADKFTFLDYNEI